MIFRIVKDENTNEIKLIPLTHIPPGEEEDAFWEKNKDTGLFIKADIVTAFPECVKYDPKSGAVYNDPICVHQRRIERKINELRETIKTKITEYFKKFEIGDSYYEGLVKILSKIEYLKDKEDEYEQCYNFYKQLHTTIEEIWFIEKSYEYGIRQTTNYSELQRYNVYEFINTEVVPRLEKVYGVYLQCETDKCCGR